MKQRNIFLLGSKQEYALMKKWANKDRKYHLNGWFHDKDIPSNPENLIDEYNNLIGDNLVDHFVLDPSDMDPMMLQASLDWAESQGSRIHMIQSGTDTLLKKLEMKDKFGPFAAVRLRSEPLSEKGNLSIKKTFDILFSLFVCITIVWWFFPIIGLIIKLSSKGPVIIRQDRVGVDGQQFQCMKFRTMVSNKAAEKGYSHLTKKDDNRITFVGSILRKTNLDELPQFLNVLMGKMSVIGPRPHMISEDHEIAEKIDKYRIRRFVKPGITGFAAIKGYRGGTENLILMQKRIDYDIKYIENWTFWMDLKIAFITFWQMITFKTSAH